jgi:hypothetical protein
VSPTPAYAGTRDTSISEDRPTTNFCSLPTLRIDGEEPPGTGRDLYALLQWDLSAILAGSEVTSATIIINVTNPTGGTYELYRISSPWEECQMTRNTRPSRGTTVRGTVGPASIGTDTIPLNNDGSERRTSIAVESHRCECTNSVCRDEACSPKANASTPRRTRILWCAASLMARAFCAPMWPCDSYASKAASRAVGTAAGCSGIVRLPRQPWQWSRRHRSSRWSAQGNGRDSAMRHHDHHHPLKPRIVQGFL